MELTKTKYKQTEVGSIPTDWNVLKLLDLCSSICDGTHYTPKYEPNGIPFYSVENVTANDFKKIKYISKEEHEKLIKRCLPEKGDILLTRIGTLGITKLIDWEVNASIYVSLALLKLNDIIHPEFLYKYTNSSFFRESLISRALTNATPQKINMGDIADIPIVFPPTLKEQKAIAEVLSDTDSLLQALEQKLAKKRAIKQGTMQKLLTPPSKTSGQGKEDWEVKKLGEVAYFFNGKAHEQYIESYGRYIVINSRFVSTSGEVFKNSTINLTPLNKGDIAMVMSDIPNGRALAKCFLVPEDNKYALNQRICGIRSEEVDNKFLYFILNRNKYYLAFDSGTGQTNLKKNDVLECPLAMPKTRKEQTHIATILSDMDEEIELIEQQIAKYKSLKQGLMQELLTGRIRLTV